MGLVAPNSAVSPTNATLASPALAGAPPKPVVVDRSSNRPFSSARTAECTVCRYLRVPDAGSEFEPLRVVQRIDEESAHMQLHLLEVMSFDADCGLPLMFDQALARQRANRRLQRRNGTPVPASLPIEVPAARAPDR